MEPGPQILVIVGYKCSFRITKALQRLLLQKEWRISHQLGIGWASDEKNEKKLAGREFGDLRTVPKLPRVKGNE